MRRFLLLSVLFTASPAAAQASLAEEPPARFTTRTARDGEAARRQSGAAFPVELLGATAGSLIGLGTGLLIASPNDCNNEDLACILERIGLAGLLSVAGAPLGTLVAGRWADTRPSIVGAAVGSVAGAAAGAGLLKLSEEIDDDALPVLYSLILYSGVHGLLTAAGSRIGALIRD